MDESFEQPKPSENAAEPVDACGCVPRPARETTAGPESDQPEAARRDTRRPAPEAAESGPAAAIEAPRRALKLVLSLQPATGAETPGYRAVVAVGAAGCDPLFRSLEVAGLPAALAEVPALVADAEARWQTQPRYPATTRPGTQAAAPPSRPGKTGRPAPPSAALGQDAPDQDAPDRDAPAQKATGQDTPAEPGSAAGAPPARSRPQPAPKPAPADQLPLFG